MSSNAINPADEAAAVADEIAALGAKIEPLRKRIFEMLNGSIATDRDGISYLIDGVFIYSGGSGYKVLVKGSRLRKDGSPHARARKSSPLGMLRCIRRVDRCGAKE